MKNGSFKMLVVFWPIFVADSKITFFYNVVTLLMTLMVLDTLNSNVENLFSDSIQMLDLLNQLINQSKLYFG